MTQDARHHSPGLGQVCEDLRQHYPTLHGFINEDRLVEIAGAFPVRGATGEELDRYSVSIILPQNYPQELPVVREVGGRIPWEPDWHVNPTGAACIIFPDDRWRCFPEQANLIDYLKGPVHNFFLSQTYRTEEGKWPFGAWEHADEGVLEYYQCLLETDDYLTVCRFLYILAKVEIREHWECPCGSEKKIKNCCLMKIRELRSKIPVDVARERFATLAGDVKLYDGRRLRKPSKRASWRSRLPRQERIR